MNDYISRQAVIQLALDGKIISTDIEKRVQDFINEIHAADVQPVKRGEWLTGEWLEDEYGYCRCSICGYEHDDPETTTPYCPNCGAKMEE